MVCYPAVTLKQRRKKYVIFYVKRNQLLFHWQSLQKGSFNLKVNFMNGVFFFDNEQVPMIHAGQTLIPHWHGYYQNCLALSIS